MCSDKIDRKDVMNDHLNLLKKGIREVQESKVYIAESIEAEKDALGNLDKTEHELNRKTELIESINIENVCRVDETSWGFYLNQYNNDINLCASLNEYANTLKDKKTYYTTVFSVNIHTNASSTTPSIYTIFTETPAETESFHTTAKKHEVEKNPIEWANISYGKLQSLDKDLAENYLSFIKDFRIVVDPNTQYARLLDLRSLIFYQLLEVHSPENKYTATDWHMNTAPGTIEIKKRFCQTKYFILGSTNFLSLPPVLQNRTDNICKDMLNLFNNLSEDGKHGADKKQTQLLFNETMSTFSQVLDLREYLYS